MPTSHPAPWSRCIIKAGPLRGITGWIVQEYPDDRLLVQFDEPKGVSVVIASDAGYANRQAASRDPEGKPAS
jgi:hypothetical protein